METNRACVSVRVAEKKGWGGVGSELMNVANFCLLSEEGVIDEKNILYQQSAYFWCWYKVLIFPKKRKERWWYRQECIPVGCVPPAHWPYFIVSAGGGEACIPCHAWPPATYAPCHAHPPATHAPLPCTPPATHGPPAMHTPCHTCPPTMHTPVKT